MGDLADELGPVSYLVVAFPSQEFRGQIATALRELTDTGIVRIIDLVFVHKSVDGEVEVVELSQLPADDQGAFAGLQDVVIDMLNDEDLEAVGEELEPGGAAAVLVWEDTWAAKLAAGMRDAQGEILDLERVPREVVLAAVAAGRSEGAS
jgi:uncharacterized membrane protein